MKPLLFFVLFPFFLFSQTQIGSDIDGAATGDNSGYVSFSSDGTIVAIGGPGNDYAGEDAGLVRVFENNSGDWVQLGNAIYGEAAGDLFGSSLSLSGNGSVLAVGGPGNDDSGEDAGRVRIFEIISGVWTQIGDDINGEVAGDRFGIHVSLSNGGTKLAISGYACCGLQHGIPSVGYTRIYENYSDNWYQSGEDISTGMNGISNVVLSGDGSVVAIASPSGGQFGWSNFYVGGVKVYKRNFDKNIPEFWPQIGDTFIGDTYLTSSNDIGGVSLTNNGTKIVIRNNISTRVYETINEEWVQQGENLWSLNYSDITKIDLSDDGTILALGGSSTRIYKNSLGTWIQVGDDINEEASNDYFGSSLSLSSDGSKIAIGAPYNDGNGIDSGHVRVYDLSALLSSNNFVLWQFSLFPNPAKDQFTISINKSIELDHVNIYNQLGQLISSTHETTVSTSGLSTGMYYVEVISNEGKATKKLIIE